MVLLSRLVPRSGGPPVAFTAAVLFLLGGLVRRVLGGLKTPAETCCSFCGRSRSLP